MDLIQILVYYIAAVSIVTFLVYGIDKRKARKHRWRIPESTLLLLAAVGGSLGALAAMKVFHHKTKHYKFTIGVPLILLVQLALGWYLFLR